jgi:hypothetical protein
MKLDSPVTTRVVEDYDFVFSSGQVMPITIDRNLGDEVDFTGAPLAISIKLCAKPSVANPDVMLPAEEVTIFQSHLIAIQKRLRTVNDLSPEQKAQWREAMKAFGVQAKSIQ